MNGIEKITARIRADAEAECAAIRAESEERCAAIRAENERAAQEEYWRLVREGVKDTEQRVQRLGRTADVPLFRARKRTDDRTPDLLGDPAYSHEIIL